jgi:hypothetical protein
VDTVAFGVEDGNNDVVFVGTRIDEFEESAMTPVLAVDEMVSE